VRRAILRFTLIRGIKYAAREELLRRDVRFAKLNGAKLNGSSTGFFSKYDNAYVSEDEKQEIIAIGDDTNAPVEGGEVKDMAELKEEMSKLRAMVFSIAQHLNVSVQQSEPTSPLAALPKAGAPKRVSTWTQEEANAKSRAAAGRRGSNASGVSSESTDQESKE
jgi:hypothetical protein